MARTNVVLNDNLIAQCRKATGIQTSRALIDYALQELLRHERQMKVLELKGRIHWQGALGQWRKSRGLRAHS